MKLIVAIIFIVFFYCSFSQEKTTKYYKENRKGDSIASKDSATKYSIEYFDTTTDRIYKEFYDIDDNTLLKRAYYMNDSTMDGLLVKYSNGKIYDSCFMKMGQLFGLNYFCHTNGQLASIIDFRTDTSMYIECFDKKGISVECDEHVEIMPEFPGGVDALMQYLKSIIRYPKDARKKGIEGKVITNFCIDENGKVKDVKILKSVYPSLNEEAMRVISEMPVWKPGIQYGRKVKVYYSLPITFKL